MDKPNVGDIVIKKFELEEGSRGGHINFLLDSIPVEELSVIYRRKGISSPGHFHKGLSKSRDPEILLMISGSIRMDFDDTGGNKKEIIIRKGDCLFCPPWIFHRYEILEDAVFLEPRIESYESNPDTYNYKDFKGSI